MSAGGDEAWKGTNQVLVHHADLNEVLGHVAGLGIVLVGLADAAEEGQWPWPSKLPTEKVEHELLSLENLVGGEALVDHVADLLQVWAVDLLILGSNVHGHNTSELELVVGHELVAQEAIKDVDREVHGLWEKAEADVNQGQPLDDDRAVVWLELGLEVQVMLIRAESVL